MSSSKARRAQVIPRSKVWRAAASSSSSESASSPVVVAHEEHASSSVRASPPAAPWEKDAPVSSATWISGAMALATVSGTAVDGVYSYQSSYGFASGQIPRLSQGTLLPLSGEPKVSNLWNNVQHKDSI
jgi:hypothetical protein